MYMYISTHVQISSSLLLIFAGYYKMCLTYIYAQHKLHINNSF